MSEGRMAHSVYVNSSEDTAERDNDDHSVSQQPAKVTSGGCDPIRMALGFLCVLLLAVVIVVRVQYYTDVQTKEKLQMMINENNVLKKNLTDMQTNDPTDIQTKDKQTIEALRQNLTDSITKLTSCQAKMFSCPSCIQLPKGATCPKPCATGWESYGGKCYWFSSNKRTWDESRKDCTRSPKGANLVKIDSKDEQIFLQGKLMQKMAEAEDKFWIGLTDSKIEDQWVWADGSTLNERFWSGREPDNWGGNKDNGPYPDGEDCVRMGYQVASEFTWSDAFCDKPHKYICEKQAGTGRVESTCV